MNANMLVMDDSIESWKDKKTGERREARRLTLFDRDKQHGESCKTLFRYNMSGDELNIPATALTDKTVLVAIREIRPGFSGGMDLNGKLVLNGDGKAK